MNADKLTRSRPRSSNAAHSLPGPEDITRRQLENGITVLSRANFSSPSVVINGYLPAGGIHDPQDKLGLAGFTASALMRGTALRDFHQLYDALETAGASLGVSGGVHTVGFRGRALAEDLDLLLGLLAEILRRATFPADQVEKLRAQMLTALAIRAQDTGDMAALTFDQIVYDGHPYSRPDDGYPETVSQIDQSDLVAFHSRYYGPSGMVIVVVGAVEPSEIVDKVSSALGDWHNPEQPQAPELPSLEPLEEVVTRRVDIPGKSQTDLVLGVAGPPRRSPNFLAAAMGNSVLGQFGMMGRIGEAVRQQAGLAYYAHSSISGGIGPGPWYVNAGVDPQNLERTLQLIQDEIVRFTSETVSEEELGDSQAQYIGSIPLSLESNAGVSAALINIERFDLGMDYFHRYPDLIRAVTTQQVLEAARRYLDPDRLAIAIAGA